MNAVVFFLGMVLGLGGSILMFVAAARLLSFLEEEDWAKYEDGDIRIVHSNNTRKE